MRGATLFLLSLVISSISYADKTLLIDRYFSPYMGAADLLSAQELMIEGEDYWLRCREPSNSYWRIFGRALEEIVVWSTIDNLAAVTQHEFFGHGYRLRQLGITPSGYNINPWGGSTSWMSSDSIAVGKVSAVTVAGLEAEAIMAQDLKMQWMRDGVIDGRLAPTYTQVAQSVFWYTLITRLGKTDVDGLVGNDVSSYIYLLNATYPNDNYTRDKLMKIALFNLIDPMTFYSYIAMFYYMGTGEAWKFPVFTLKNDMQYLPNIRIAYAPYAPEVYFENYFVINHEPLYVYIRGSNRSIGAGAAYATIWSYSKGNIGFRFDCWNQNNYITSATLHDLEITGTAYRPALKQRIWGAALSLTGTINISSKLNLYAELGGKSAGYLAGYALDAAIVARVGLAHIAL